MYIYTSNETSYDVFFDNLQVTHIRGSLLEETHYYPFGLTMAGISSKALSFGNPENKNEKFQGQPLDDDLELNWYGFKWRNHDPQIGRFIEIDPLSEKYDYNSTYAFSENKVVSHFELEGLESVESNQPWRLFTGNAAHRAFTDYIRRVDPKEKNWHANRQVGNGDLIRPDLVYDGKSAGGVWELKPDYPSPSAVLAGLEAQVYATALNVAENTDKYSVGTTGGTPAPFNETLTLTDDKTKKVFNYRLDPVNGGIYYTENKTERKEKTQTATEAGTEASIITPMSPMVPSSLNNTMPAPAAEGVNRRPNGPVPVLRPSLLTVAIQAALEALSQEAAGSKQNRVIL